MRTPAVEVWRPCLYRLQSFFYLWKNVQANSSALDDRKYRCQIRLIWEKIAQLTYTFYTVVWQLVLSRR